MTRQDLRRFAPFGLYLAGLAAIVSIGLIIIQGNFNLWTQISLALVVVGIAGFILMNPEGALHALTGRQARYGSNALLLTVAFIGIVVVANYLVNSHSIQWDLTEDKTNSLTAESVKTLQSLKEPVLAKAFYSAQMPVESARTLLQNYKNKANGKFDFKVIDPVQNPIEAQQAKITRDGTLVLTMGNRQEQVTSPTEESITSALIRLANPGKRTIYFLTGHGEFTTDGSSDRSYSTARSELEAKNYTVNTLNLLASPKIPDDALALIVAGPAKPLSQQEVDLIKAYQQKGGKLVYLADPTPVTQFGDQKDPMEAYLLENWGVLLDNDVVIDLNSTNKLVVFSSTYGNSPITSQMYSSTVEFPITRSVRAEKDQANLPKDITLTELVTTSANTWGETDFKSIESQQEQPDPNKDFIGPVSLAVSGENSTTKARLLVVGTSRFGGTDSGINFYTQYGNSDFLLNGIDWTAAQDNLISLTPRQPIQRYLVPQQRTTMGLILFGSVFLLPGLVLLMGITTWVQRRRRG